MSVSATGREEPTAAPAAFARFSMSFMFFLSPIPLPAETTRSAWLMGVSMGMPTVKSCPSFFSASTRAATLSSDAPSRKSWRLRTPVMGAGFLATERLPPPLPLEILPMRWEAITTR